ncbi:MAG: HD domain-containing protein [Firmicutes bacterium]|nr:HD domain-containing protein [Bacillota bacterium]
MLKPWREVCAEELRGQSEADSIRFWRVAHTVEGETRAPFNYRFEHTLAVVKLARWLAAEEGADVEVLECAAWLHDCRKQLNAQRGKDTHAQEAAQAVEGILAGTDFPASKIEAVKTAILHHVGLRLSHRLEPLEAACLWDADKLSKLGAAGIAHFTCISGAFEPIGTETLLARSDLWLPLAEGIVASLNTATAQREGQERLAFQRNYYAQLRREWEDSRP